MVEPLHAPHGAAAEIDVRTLGGPMPMETAPAWDISQPDALSNTASPNTMVEAQPPLDACVSKGLESPTAADAPPPLPEEDTLPPPRSDSAEQLPENVFSEELEHEDQSLNMMALTENYGEDDLNLNVGMLQDVPDDSQPQLHSDTECYVTEAHDTMSFSESNMDGLEATTSMSTHMDMHTHIEPTTTTSVTTPPQPQDEETSTHTTSLQASTIQLTNSTHTTASTTPALSTASDTGTVTIPTNGQPPQSISAHTPHQTTQHNTLDTSSTFTPQQDQNSPHPTNNQQQQQHPQSNGPGLLVTGHTPPTTTRHINTSSASTLQSSDNRQLLSSNTESSNTPSTLSTASSMSAKPPTLSSTDPLSTYSTGQPAGLWADTYGNSTQVQNAPTEESWTNVDTKESKYLAESRTLPSVSGLKEPESLLPKEANPNSATVCQQNNKRLREANGVTTTYYDSPMDSLHNTNSEEENPVKRRRLTKRRYAGGTNKESDEEFEYFGNEGTGLNGMTYQLRPKRRNDRYKGGSVESDLTLEPHHNCFSAISDPKCSIDTTNHHSTLEGNNKHHNNLSTIINPKGGITINEAVRKGGSSTSLTTTTSPTTTTLTSKNISSPTSKKKPTKIKKKPKETDNKEDNNKKPQQPEYIFEDSDVEFSISRIYDKKRRWVSEGVYSTMGGRSHITPAIKKSMEKAKRRVSKTISVDSVPTGCRFKLLHYSNSQKEHKYRLRCSVPTHETHLVESAVMTSTHGKGCHGQTLEHQPFDENCILQWKQNNPDYPDPTEVPDPAVSSHFCALKGKEKDGHTSHSSITHKDVYSSTKDKGGGGRKTKKENAQDSKKRGGGTTTTVPKGEVKEEGEGGEASDLPAMNYFAQNYKKRRKLSNMNQFINISVAAAGFDNVDTKHCKIPEYIQQHLSDTKEGEHADYDGHNQRFRDACGDFYTENIEVTSRAFANVERKIQGYLPSTEEVRKEAELLRSTKNYQKHAEILSNLILKWGCEGLSLPLPPDADDPLASVQTPTSSSKR